MSKPYFIIEIYGDCRIKISANGFLEPKAVPLTCHGHSRPVTHLNFSPTVDHDQFYMISGCKGQYLVRHPQPDKADIA